MKVLVDTSVWSLVLRRRRKDISPDERELVHLMGDLIRLGAVVLIGVVRQELLAGINDPAVFQEIREYLRFFEEVSLIVDDFEEAAAAHMTCRRGGITGTPIEMLICAVSMRLEVPILTTDVDFTHYARFLPIRVPTARQLQRELARS